MRVPRRRGAAAAIAAALHGAAATAPTAAAALGVGVAGFQVQFLCSTSHKPLIFRPHEGGHITNQYVG